MVDTRLQKVMNVRDSIPTPEVFGSEDADLLVVGWGSPYGAIRSATEAMQKDGKSIARIHLRHVYPLPHGLEEIFGRAKRIIVPELNMGQLARLLTSEYPGYTFESFHKVQGKPFMAPELKVRFDKILEETS